jgi:hypothetical protein
MSEHPPRATALCGKTDHSNKGMMLAAERTLLLLLLRLACWGQLARHCWCVHQLPLCILAIVGCYWQKRHTLHQNATHRAGGSRNHPYACMLLCVPRPATALSLDGCTPCLPHTQEAAA